MNLIKPNFFLVGGSKCGTTNISYYLEQHPEIFFSKLNEPYYFAKKDLPKNYNRPSMITDYKKYLELFSKGKNCKVIGEASSVYLACPHAPELIHEVFPNSKILISIRNPIEKAHSSFFSYKFMYLNKENFSEMIKLHLKDLESNEFNFENILVGGFFTEQIKRYYKIFPKKNIKLIIFEDYIQDTFNQINNILKFLELKTMKDFDNVSKGAYRTPKNKIGEIIINNRQLRNIATKCIPVISRQKLGDKFLLKQTKKPKMDYDDRLLLKKLYSDEVKKLENYLNLKLPWNDFK